MEYKTKKILLAHSNKGDEMINWHNRRELTANRLGYNLKTFNMAEHFSYTIFPKLDKKWRKKDYDLLKFYELLGEKIDRCDVFIHYNGALIHPDFLNQFKKVKIYHCADDPDASSVLSKPVALNYDYCAISNPACIKMYENWGCKNVFFWPLGSFHSDCSRYDKQLFENQRKTPLVFIGSKRGVSNIRFIGKYLGLFQKTAFMNKLENRYSQLVAYGSGWSNGRISNSLVPDLYKDSLLGFNLHNSLGPINGRLYDLPAFGVCQICDNKKNLNLVFEEGKEIVGYENSKECFEKIDYLFDNPEKALEIAKAGHRRFVEDYSDEAIWKNFILNLEK